MSVSAKFGSSGSASVLPSKSGSGSASVRWQGAGSVAASLSRITAAYSFNPTGGLCVSGSARVLLGFRYFASGKLSISGLAVVVPPVTWQLIDTFTGSNGTGLNATTCDTGQTRFTQISDGSIVSNQGSLPFTWMHYTALANVPTKLVWDYVGVGVFVDGFFYWDGNVGSAVGYGVRMSNGDAQLLRRGSITGWTTGSPTGLGTSGTVTVTLTSDTITVNVNGHILTFVESGGLLDNTVKIVGLASNGGTVDNFYVQ